jgi:hypothetical protein
MYTIINKTQGKNFISIGNWPMDVIYSMLNNGDDIIVISSYSNTIKIPVGFGTEYEDEWEFKEYKYSPDMFK